MSWQTNIDEHLKVVAEARDALDAPVRAFMETAQRALRAGNKLLVAGNGGSAADAQHFATELVGRFYVDRPALAAIALTVDSSLLTAVANDLGFDRVFARQVEGLGRSGDVFVAISTSGNSPNILEAAQRARGKGLTVVALTGAGGGALLELADVAVRAPSTNVARIQEVHELVLHSVAEFLEAGLSEG